MSYNRKTLRFSEAIKESFASTEERNGFSGWGDRGVRGKGRGKEKNGRIMKGIIWDYMKRQQLKNLVININWYLGRSGGASCEGAGKAEQRELLPRLQPSSVRPLEHVHAESIVLLLPFVFDNQRVGRVITFVFVVQAPSPLHKSRGWCWARN